MAYCVVQYTRLHGGFFLSMLTFTERGNKPLFEGVFSKKCSAVSNESRQTKNKKS